jgi:hypothetical protein
VRITSASGASALLAEVLERLARVALPPVVEQREPRARAFDGERDVQLSKRGGVPEEERVGLLALTAPWHLIAVHHAVGATGGPVMVGGGATFAVGPRAAHQAEIVKAASAVAQRALRNVGKQPLKLILAHHPVRAEDSQQAAVGVGERRAAEVMTTTSPDDTSPVSRNRTRRRTHEKTSR